MGLADRVLDGLGPTFATKAGPLLDAIVDALTGPAQTTDELFAPTVDGWPALLDIDATPQPWWLAQITGTTVDPSQPITEQGAQIVSRPEWRRGTLAALRSAVQTCLIGAQRVDVAERDTSPWHATLTVYASELADGVTLADVEAAAATQKPVGIILTCVIANGATYNHMQVVHPMPYAQMSTYWGTYAAYSHHQPEEGTVP